MAAASVLQGLELTSPLSKKDLSAFKLHPSIVMATVTMVGTQAATHWLPASTRRRSTTKVKDLLSLSLASLFKT